MKGDKQNDRQGVALTDEWQLVPVTPTPWMLTCMRVGWEYGQDAGAEKAYREGLAAAPSCASSSRAEVERDAARYRWLKLQAPPGQPIDLFSKMREAKHLLEAFEVFCTSWAGWDSAIDACILGVDAVTNSGESK